ncbi:NAD(P)H-binding protein [Virgisporangium aurantiacum]|uniref:NmrA family transcriptional regulator n=1 Tax=Virgisporangium aurantiacum TaxID=175570 RepID=A0A8J3YZ28_9ACTN|nr:NAD(P)H-binding protein [Virgisporangium aurantiacum]GIJ54314.1 NmrA family transcriptional regulator [Virgisporangium aurantiacum]
MTPESGHTVLITNGTGKTGRRLGERLDRLGVPVRLGSRNGATTFDWGDRRTWKAALDGASAAYVTYVPDLAATGATTVIEAFTDAALAAGTRRLVLLSGRGEEEAQECEKIVAGSGADWTVLRCSWFAQNFDEGYLLDPILAGEVALPAGDVGEPFVDLDDVAEVAAAVLTGDGHLGEVYELTGPGLLTFSEAVDVIARTAGIPIVYRRISPAEFTAALDPETPADIVELLSYLFTTVLDGRNAHLGDGVQRALGRQPRDFAAYAHAAAATGVWTAGGTR